MVDFCKFVPPLQITPNPHNIPNKANKAPIRARIIQHKGEHRVFLAGGSCWTIILGC